MEAHDTFTFPSHSAAVESSPSTQHVEVPAKRARADSTEDEPFPRDQSIKCPTSIALQAALPPEPSSPVALTLEERSNSLPGPLESAASVTDAVEQDGRRQRSNSLPLPLGNLVVPPSTRSLGKRRARPPLPSARKLAPLSQHQLLTLHQLRLPRPSYNALSRTSVAHSGIGAASSLAIPSLIPPISRSTLRELDLPEILRNPQLRHDIVFDPHLMFRPNFDGERGDKKRNAGDRYWLALAAEVERGCRCSTWGPMKGGEMEVLDCVCAAAGLASSAIDVLLQGGRDRMVVDGPSRAGAPVMAAPPLAARLPSRIPPLVAELKAILLSLLPAPSQQQGAGSAEQISAVLDEELIAQEVAHGVLDVGALARFLGSTLKMHCAPMRDEAVDRMVAKVEEGQIAGGLKACFEMLELMKLDIANHQLRTLRPFLLETALDFELKHLYDVHERGSAGPTAAFERTTTWFEEATTRCGSDNVAVAVCDGLLELAFSPDHLAPSLPQRGSSRRSFATSLIFPAPMANQIPETFHLDLNRLQSFHADMTDLTVLCLLVLLYRQLCTSMGHSPTDEEIEVVRHECWILIASPASALLPLSATTGTIAEREAAIAAMAVAGPGAGLRKLDHADWRANLQDAALQLLRHLPAVTLPSTEQLSLVGGWLDTNVRAGSELFAMVQRRLKMRLTSLIEDERTKMTSSDAALLGVTSAMVLVKEEVAETPTGCIRRGHVVNASVMAGKRRHSNEDEEVEDEPVAKRRRRPNVEGSTTTTTTTTTMQLACLLPLDEEIRALATRMARVVGVHLRVYTGWYNALLESGEPPGLIVHDEVRPNSTASMMHGRGS